MTPIADMVAQMLAAGVAHDVIVLAVRTAEATASTPIRVENRVESQLDKRREWDRNYRRTRKANRVESTRNPPEIHPTTKTPLILTEEDIEKEPLKKVRGRRKPNTEIPPDWKPPERAYTIATEVGVKIADVEPRFRDYLASSGKTYADYDAGFCNFVRNTPKFSGAPNGYSGFAPRPGSKEDNRERTHHALRKLSDYVDAHSDDQSGSGPSREANAGLLPFVKPA